MSPGRGRVARAAGCARPRPVRRRTSPSWRPRRTSRCRTPGWPRRDGAGRPWVWTLPAPPRHRPGV
ncbi:hypothetical protein [Ornithinimicrobium kibberense]|uniref:hypothetical protein n=1 Tax=Ornithinimicrobium kibberense TaxID=282060 RepID=UPI00360C2261